MYLLEYPLFICSFFFQLSRFLIRIIGCIIDVGGSADMFAVSNGGAGGQVGGSGV